MDGITHSFVNSNGAAVDVLELTNDLIWHFTEYFGIKVNPCLQADP